MLFFLYRIGIFLVLHIPLEKSYRLAKIIGRVYCFFAWRDRAALYDNLKSVFPQKTKRDISRIVKEVFINFGKYLVDFFRFSLINKDYIAKNIEIIGIENLDKALSENKGVIISSAHLGNWELGAAVVAILGYKFSSVVLKHRHKRVDDYFMKQRQTVGIGLIKADAISLRRCYKCLSENGVLALVGDRDYFDNGIKIPFFDREISVPKGPAILSLRLGSPIVSCFMIRKEDDTFKLMFYEPISHEPTGDEEQDIRLLSKRFMEIIEKVIREYPGQWYVFHRFWEKMGWKM